MTKGLENLPFDGAELDIAVEAINAAVELLSERIGARVEIEFQRDGASGVRSIARWMEAGFSFNVYSGGGVPLQEGEVYLFQAFLDSLVWQCLTYVKKEANRAA